MLTDKQQKVLNIITDYVWKNAKSPTIDELQVLLEQKSKRGVVQYLQALEKKWFITRVSGYRGIRLKNSLWLEGMINLPILWVANAGQPLSIAEEIQYWKLPLSKNVISWDPKKYFVIKVDGTSMNEFKVKGKNIENESYVLVDKTQTAINEKDAFLFVVEWAATIKVAKKEWKNLYLVPKSRDKHHQPIILQADDSCVVNGKIVDVFNFG